ncbi:hypothetical protein ACSBR1_007240 [Camellia fascicularis]
MPSYSQYSWLCIRDLNEIGVVSENQGGVQCRLSQLQSLQELQSDCGLMNLEFKGPPYTWTNNQVGVANICERLDRVVATMEWRSLYPCAKVFHEVQFSSDHCPLILNCSVLLKKVPQIFKFENIWTSNPDCARVIQSKWKGPHINSPMI